MNARENFLAMMNHEKVEWIPNFFTDLYRCGGALETFENGPEGGGEDGFGCRWHATTSANGQPVPEPGFCVLDGVTAWEDKVRFPNLDLYDWKGEAERQKANFDPVNQVLEYHSWNSQFLRLTTLMGFEDALCALYEEPEACYDLMGAITDYKIRLIERVHDYFHAETFVNFDDVATERGLFISRKTYQELIKPHHKRMNDAARAYGMMPVQHCCGYCQDIIEDFIDEGSVAWQSAQPSNDLEMIIREYGDRISVVGGYDTQGAPGRPDVTTEEIEREVSRCVKTYGKYGKGYAFMGFLLGEQGDAEIGKKMQFMVQQTLKQSHEVL